MIKSSNPDFSPYYPPDNKFRALVFWIIKSKLFDPFIMLCIVANIVTMALGAEGAS